MLKSLSPMVRIPLRLLASAGFATVTIVLCALVLVWSTLWGVKTYGQAATEFGIYQSWWFALLLWLLGINVLAATIVKLPWRRSQTGFLVVHAGIIVLLIGCWFTREYGMIGQLRVAEGETASVVTENSQHFELQIEDLSGKNKTKTVRIPFRPGPFNWCDYDRLAWFPWHWARRDRGTIYDNLQGGIKLKVLDYMADSELVPVPELILDIRPADSRLQGSMDAGSSEVVLSVDPRSDRPQRGEQIQLPTGEFVSFGLVDNKAAAGAFLDALPKSPLGPLGQVVLHVIKGPDASPKAYRFSVAKLIEDGGTMIGDTSLHVEVKRFWPWLMWVELSVFDTKKRGVQPRTIMLNAFKPIANRQDPEGLIGASFWFSPYFEEMGLEEKRPGRLYQPDFAGFPVAEESTTNATVNNSVKVAFSDALRKIIETRPEVLDGDDITLEMIEKDDFVLRKKMAELFVLAKVPRVDLIQGPGNLSSEKDDNQRVTAAKQPPQLYMREWNGRRIVSAVRFDPESKQIEWFAGSGRPLLVNVVGYIPADPPGLVIQAIPFQKNVPDIRKLSTTQRAQIRLTVGKVSETFWLTDRSFSEDPFYWKKTIIDNDQRVSVLLRCNKIELGFGVHLDDFTIDYDPDRQPIRYASQVDFVPLPDPKSNKKIGQIYEEDVIIEGNRPATFKDPFSGRVYRFFQSRFEGPYRAGSAKSKELTDENRKRESFYHSFFSVAYDPGRFWKYAGCFMILFGIAIMYCMKAYFFRRFSSKMERG